MTAWNDHFAAERERIETLLRDAGLEGMPLGRPPTRADTIKHCWITARNLWPTHATEGGLVIEHDLGIIEPIHFEQIRYGNMLVIEAEGVVVERLQMKSPPSAK